MPAITPNCHSPAPCIYKHPHGAEYSGAPPVILDVRKRAAFDEFGEMISGATWRDPFDIKSWIDDLATEIPLIVHCVHGHEVSQLAGQILRDMGFDTRVLFGGIGGWRDAGGDVVPATQNAMTRS